MQSGGTFCPKNTIWTPHPFQAFRGFSVVSTASGVSTCRSRRVSVPDQFSPPCAPATVTRSNFHCNTAHYPKHTENDREVTRSPFRAPFETSLHFVLGCFVVLLVHSPFSKFMDLFATVSWLHRRKILSRPPCRGRQVVASGKHRCGSSQKMFPLPPLQGGLETFFGGGNISVGAEKMFPDPL